MLRYIYQIIAVTHLYHQMFYMQFPIFQVLINSVQVQSQNEEQNAISC